MTRYANLAAGGEALAQAPELAAYARDPRAIVLALARGGVPAAIVVARALELPIDVALKKRLIQPANYGEEGVEAATICGKLIVGDEWRQRGANPKEPVDYAVGTALQTIEADTLLCRGDAPVADITGRIALLVDNGMRTGTTMAIVARAARAAGASRIVAAVPVSDPASRPRVEPLVDELVSLQWQEPYGNVAMWYRKFDVPHVETIKSLLDSARC